VEINCPLDCPYYVEGLKHHQQKMMHQRIKKEGAKSYVRKAELYKNNPQLFAHLEKGFVSIFRADKSLTNRDLVSGLDMAKKTLETEKKGLLYQHQSGNHYADEISDHALRIISEFMVIGEFLDEARFYMENDSSTKSYLTHLMRYHPEEEAPAQADSRLIIAP